MVRGALAMLKVASTPEAKKDSWHQEQLAYQQVHRALSIAKAKLSQSEVSDLEEWAARQLKEQSRAAGKLGANVASLGLLPLNLSAKSFAAELESSVAQLEHDIQPLLGFCERVLELQNAFAANEWQTAKEILKDVAKRHGRSYWELEFEIAIEQLIGGVEKMKGTVARLSAGASGVQKFLLHYVGVRNEPAQTASRFKEHLAKRLNEDDLKDGLRTYLKYRLYGELRLDEKTLAHILSAEQLTTSIDLLFTTFAIVKWIKANEGAYSRKTNQLVNQAAIRLLSLTKKLKLRIEFSAANTESTIPRHPNLCLSETYFSHSTDLLLLARESIAQFWSRPSEATLTKKENQLDRVISGVVSRLSTRSSGVAAEDLAKLQLNFATVPFLFQLGDTSDIPHFVTLYLDCLRGAAQSTWPSSLKQALNVALSSELANDIESNQQVATSLNILTKVVNANRNGDEDSAIQLLLTTRGLTDLESDAFLVIAATIQQQVDRIPEAIRTTALAGVQNDRLISLLPLNEIFQGARWNTLRVMGPSVELSICLDLYLRSSGDTKARSYKRFSIEELLKKHNCDSLVDLVDILFSEKYEADLVEYFFETACDLYTLELLPNVGHSKRAQQLRIDVLRKLAKFLHANALTYLEEANTIESTLGVNDGLEMLDDSRVYVDESRVLTAVNRELGADFQRYLHLVQAGVGTSESFADILKSIKTPSAKTFQIPTNDADDLFGETTYRIREKFLFDPASGLDIHIGRRIRHGTIASHLRGPLEALFLIGQRPKAGADYEPPESITTVCLSLDAKSRSRVYGAFSRFSESIDSLIIVLRDEYFHVQSKAKPRGMFDVPVNAILLALARGIAQTCSSIEEYSKHCLGLFWMLLAAKMAAAQRPMENESRRVINSAFEKLMQELHAIGIKDTSLHTSLQQALEELRKRVISMGNWMRVPKASVEGKAFSMQRIVDVAVALVKGQRPGFKPIIKSEVPDYLALDTYGFSVVVDMLYIGLDNVCQHSGKKVDNNISITITFNKQTSLLSFTMLSELGRDGRTPEKETRVNGIRANIARKTYGDSARLDRNSGLSKLAALVLQSDATSIDFDFIDHSHFLLKFDLHYIGGAEMDKKDSVEEFISQIELEAEADT